MIRSWGTAGRRQLLAARRPFSDTFGRMSPLMAGLNRRLLMTVCAVAATAGAPLCAQIPVSVARDSTVVSGTVVGVDGRIPVRADVELIPVRATDRGVRARVGANGTFRVATVDPGPYRLRAAGVGYVGFERAIPAQGRTQIGVAVTLAGFPAGLAKGPLVGVSSEDDAEKPRPDMPPAVLLTAAEGGRRSGKLRARRDTIAYRVVDITARLFLSPAGATAYRWAADGEYEGLLVARAGADVELTYDSSLVATGGASAFKVTDGHPLAAAVAQLDSIVGAAHARACLLAAQAPPIDPRDARIIDSALTSQLQLVRRLLRAESRCQVHPALGSAVLAQFTPASPLWQLDDIMQRRVILLAARHAAGESRFNTPTAVAAVRERFDAGIAAAPDSLARFDLYEAAARTFMPADTISAQSYAARFVRESYDNPRLPALLKLTGYNRVLQPGRMVPAFRLASLDSVGRTVTDVALRGKVYLLDVWATWCPDCIVEFPAMRELHTRFGPRGLTILSVSVDEEQETPQRFRRSREQMPWMHAWAGVAPDGEGPLAKFEVAWLPTTILVGKDGRILAIAPKLQSPEFEALIESVLR